jgi:hypothetical protein
MSKLATLVVPARALPAVAVAALLLAIACGGGGSPTPSPTPSPSPAVVLLSPTVTPAATPTTARIFFLSSREPRGTYLMDADGSNLTWIGGMLQVPEVDIWSPDESKVAFVRCPDKEEALQFDAGDRNSELIVANADGSGEVNVSNHPRADVFLCYTDAPNGGFDWSPDGSRLAFYSSRDPSGLYVVNADGSGLAFLVDGVMPSWSPDGEVIAFIGDADEANREMDLEAIRPDGSDRTLLASIPCSESPLWSPCVAAPSVRWSPDGALLTFSALPEPSSAIFTLRADGSGLTQVTHPPGGDAGPIWVDCTRPTAGCEARVTNVAPEGLNIRQEPGKDASPRGKLGDGELVCFIGPSRFIDGFRWWPARSEEGIEGWSAAFDPAEPSEAWLTATGRSCSGRPGTLQTVAFRAFAAEIDLALQQRNLAFFRQQARTEHVVCTLENMPQLPGGPNCQTVGQQFDGFSVAGWRSEGGLLPIDEALQTIERLWLESVPNASDEFSGSAPSVYATGKQRSADEAVHTAVLTALITRPANFEGSGPLRFVLVTSWVQEGSDWRFVSLLVAFVGGDEFLRPDPVIENFVDDWQRFQP